MEESEQNLKTDNQKIYNLKTYQSDMAEAVRQNEASVIKIAMAEKRKREQESLDKKTTSSNRSKVFLIIGGLVMIVAAVYGAMFLLQKKNAPYEPPTVTQKIEGIISYDESVFDEVNASFTKIDLINVIDKEVSQLGKAGTIKAIFPVGTDADNNKILLPLKNFVSLLGITAPSSFLRSLSGNYMVGTYTNKNGADSNLFFIFETNDYNNAYAGMLSWESTMVDDLFPVFHLDVSGENQNLFVKPFQDIFINNKDARVLKNKNDEAVLYYIFANRSNLIISKSEDAIKEISARLVSKNTKPL